MYNPSLPALLLLSVCISCTSCSFFGKKNAPKTATVSATTEQVQTRLSEPEIQYLKNRDAYIQQLKIQQSKFNREAQNLSYSSRDSLCQLMLYNPDRKFILVLEKQLKDILRGSKFPSRGEINLETLLEGDMGMGMLDGLSFGNDAIYIVHTTRPLFLDYLKKNKMSTTLENMDSETLRLIFQYAFSSDAAISNLSDLKLISGNGVQAYGMLGLEAQDDGIYFANCVFVMVIKGNYVYLGKKALAQAYVIRNKCVSKYEEKLALQRRTQKPWEAGKPDSSIIIGDRIWNEYCACCRQEVKKDKKFVEIQTLMTKLANQLAN